MNNRIYFLSLICLLILSLPTLLNAAGASNPMNLPFGGQIMMTQTCNDGMLLTVREPRKGSNRYFWRYGMLLYREYSMPHVNQWLVGMASQMTTECRLGQYTVGSGYPIQYHGSSL